RAEITKPGLELQKGGQPQDGIVYLAPFHSLDSKVPLDVKNRLKHITYGIINGTIQVPERSMAR
ncbi:MAG TPA: hypothetical protein VFJ51_03735, partial [Nitrososphaeraceae archaeon]|nr:hypothetical protein [Nitrososphaeraceae archaeon]